MHSNKTGAKGIPCQTITMCEKLSGRTSGGSYVTTYSTGRVFLTSPTTTTVVLHCDNRGVNSHGNSKLRSLPEKQRQADHIRHIKHISQTMQVQVKWEWVEGHAVERKGRHRSTVPECLNDQADKLAKAALLLAISGGIAYEGEYPFEMVSIKLTEQGVSGSP
jgi:hypothetical protein